jgi:hypothetical protein
MIDTGLWENEDIIEHFTAEDRYFWLYILTNPHNKMCGVLKYSPALIARDMGLHKDTIINLVYRFERIHELLYCDKETNEILILNWYKFNWTKSPKIISIIEKEKNDLKSENIKALIDERISCVVEEKPIEPIGYRYPSNPITNTITNPIYNDYGFSTTIIESIEKWLKYKKEKRQTYKETGLKTLLNKIEKDIGTKGEQFVIDSIEFSITNNYSGIYPPKAKEEAPKPENPYAKFKIGVNI